MKLPDIGPQQTEAIPAPRQETDKLLKGEIWLTVSLRLQNGTVWASAGHEIAWAQFCVRNALKPAQHESTQWSSAPTIRDNGHSAAIVSAETTFYFNKVTGRVVSWTSHGQELFLPGAGPRLTMWRAPTDNDKPQDAVMWRRFGLDVLEEDIRSVQLAQNSTPYDGVTITVQSRLAPPCLAWGFNVTTTYTLLPDSTLLIHAALEPQGPIPESIPRVGFEMDLPSETQKVAWFGKGPGQSYSDSQHGVKVGLYEAEVDQLTTQYDVPQENGNRTRTRWIHTQNHKGWGLQAELKNILVEQDPRRQSGFDFAVQRHTPKQMTEARHPHELPESQAVILRLDVSHHGLGSGSCGPKTWGEHVLKSQKFEFEVRLKHIERKL